MNDYLEHRSTKYLSKKKVNGKWRYYYKYSKYHTTSKNYKDQKKKALNSEEWKDIERRKDPEYIYRDSDGNIKNDVDKYMINKRHPILDALADYGMGRKTTVLKQDETVRAGAEDYAQMAHRTVENVMSLSVGIITAKLKNQQGSYDETKQQIRQDVNTAKKSYRKAMDTAKLTQKNASSYTEDDYAKAIAIGESYMKKYMR